MLIYQIRNPKARPESAPVTVKDIITRAQILKNNISRCHFKIGDCIKFKKPKKSPHKGTITHIEDDHNKVVFSHGGMCPMNITVRIEQEHGEMEVKTNMKKILYVHRGAPV